MENKQQNLENKQQNLKNNQQHLQNKPKPQCPTLLTAPIGAPYSPTPCLSETFCCVYVAKATYTQQHASEFFGEAFLVLFAAFGKKYQNIGRAQGAARWHAQNKNGGGADTLMGRW